MLSIADVTRVFGELEVGPKFTDKLAGKAAIQIGRLEAERDRLTTEVDCLKRELDQARREASEGRGRERQRRDRLMEMLDSLQELLEGTAVHIPHATRKMLRAVAFKRAEERGGRPSVSALISELVEEHRKELEKEAGPYLG